MKEIRAYIKPHKLNDVTLALQKVEKLRGMSIVEMKGFGRGERTEGSPSLKVDELMDFAKYIKIEIFCHNDFVDELVSIIDKIAYTGLRGDGKIYVLDVEKAFKIGRGEIGRKR